MYTVSKAKKATRKMGALMESVAVARKNVTFKNGRVAKFEFTLLSIDDGRGYGNGTAVHVVDKAETGTFDESIDTRYDATLKSDGSNFGEWADAYLRDRFGALMRSCVVS